MTRNRGKERRTILPGPVSRWRFARAVQGRFGLLLIALMVLVIIAPLAVNSAEMIAVPSLLTGAVLMAGLHAARPGRLVMLGGFTFLVIDFLVGRLIAPMGGRTIAGLQAMLWFLTLSYVTATILEAIFESSRVTLKTLQAALCVYLLLGIMGGFAFCLVEISVPGAFHSTTDKALAWTGPTANSHNTMRMMEFSFACISGTSATDLEPTRAFAANAASLEAMLGQIYLAVVIARLVGIESASALQEPGGERSNQRQPENVS